MKDILEEKIKIEVKLYKLHLMQLYYEGRTDFCDYKDLLSKSETKKKKLLTLIDDEGDYTIRRKLQDKPYPFKFYCENIYKEGDEE